MDEWTEAGKVTPDPHLLVEVKVIEAICKARIDEEGYWKLVTYPKITQWRNLKKMNKESHIG